MDGSQRTTEQGFCEKILFGSRNPQGLEALVLTAVRVRSHENGLCMECGSSSACKARFGDLPRLRSAPARKRTRSRNRSRIRRRVREKLAI